MAPQQLSRGEITDKLVGYGLSRSDCLDILAYLYEVPYKEVVQGFFPEEVNSLKLEEILARLEAGEPVAYITGHKEFYGMELAVTPDVLIPRPETEILVETVLKNSDSFKPFYILDLYTGSGCILLALLANLPQGQGTGVDISGEALKVAQINARKYGLGNRAAFEQADITGDNFKPDTFLNKNPGAQQLIITANPPYLSQEEYGVAGISLGYEPAGALIGAQEGYHHYKKLLCSLAKLGNNSFHFYMEVGYSQGVKVQEIAHSYGLEAFIIKDLAGHDRVVWGYAGA